MEQSTLFQLFLWNGPYYCRQRLPEQLYMKNNFLSIYFQAFCIVSLGFYSMLVSLRWLPVHITGHLKIIRILIKLLKFEMILPNLLFSELLHRYIRHKGPFIVPYGHIFMCRCSFFPLRWSTSTCGQCWAHSWLLTLVVWLGMGIISWLLINRSLRF